MKKTVASIFLVIAMILPMLTTAFAAPRSRPCFKYQRIFQLMGGEVEAAVTTDATQAYTLHLANTTAQIEESILPDGTIRVNIEECGLTDEILEYPDGTIYLNGDEVTIDSYVEAAEGAECMVGLSNNVIAPRAAQRYEIVKTCPYGNAGDYIDGATSWKNVGIGKNNTFRNITLTAFASIMCAAIGLLSSGVGAALLAAGVKETFDLIKSKAPDANALSLSDYRSVHRLYGFTISSSLSVARHETTYFYNSDYTGKIGSSHIYYEKFTY